VFLCTGVPGNVVCMHIIIQMIVGGLSPYKGL